MIINLIKGTLNLSAAIGTGLAAGDAIIRAGNEVSAQVAQQMEKDHPSPFAVKTFFGKKYTLARFDGKKFVKYHGPRSPKIFVTLKPFRKVYDK